MIKIEVRKMEKCPFCESTCLTVDLDVDAALDGLRYQWAVECNGCLARGPVKDTQKEAEAAWNRRR